jgi:hypothetical protein
MFLAQGIATGVADRRAGALHALLLFGTGSDVVTARSSAMAGAGDLGWEFLDIRRETELGSDLSGIEDDVLRSAAEKAVRLGHSMVTYTDELPLNS